MKEFFESNNFLFKILFCFIIITYIFMCLFGSYVCAASNKTYHCEPLNYDFTLNANDSFDSNNIKFLLYSYIYTIDSTNETKIAFYPIFYTGTAYFDKDNQKLHIKNGARYYMAMSRIYDESNLEDIAEYFQTTFDEDFSTKDFSFLVDEQYFEEDSVISLYQNGCTTKSYYAIGSNNVYDYINQDDILFPGARQELAGVTIPAIQSAEEIPQAIIKTMKVVIPVGLVILGIGLVIYLIKSVILRMQ